jgi:hypothetical protein
MKRAWQSIENEIIQKEFPGRRIGAGAEQPRTPCGDRVKVTNVQMEGDSEGAPWVALRHAPRVKLGHMFGATVSAAACLT